MSFKDKLITRNRTVSILLYALCVAFSSLLVWGFYMSIQQGLGLRESIIAMPTQLEIAWGTVLGLIVGGHEEEVNKMEKMLNYDIDKDGDIGVENSPTVEQNSVVTQSVIPAQEVSFTDAENNASTYNIRGQ